MAVFLGIDAGGSKTRCALGDEERVLATASGSSCKIQRVGEEEARRALHTVIEDVCRSAGVLPSNVEHVCLGISGASEPDAAEAMRRILGEVISTSVEVIGDIVIALEANLGSTPGCIVIAGTGSIAVGRDQHGRMVRVGGWGPAVSDEGSGYWIGRSAVSAVLRAHDAGKSTTLEHAMIKTRKLSLYEDFVRTAMATPPPDFAQLFPTVLKEAQAGDPIAREIIKQAGVELAELAVTVIRQLWPQEQQGVRVVVTGGVFENAPMIFDVFTTTVRNAFPQVMVHSGNVEPMMGALSLARKRKVS